MKITADELTKMFLEYEVANMSLSPIPLPEWIQNIVAKWVANKVSRKVKRFRKFLESKDGLK